MVGLCKRFSSLDGQSATARASQAETLGAVGILGASPPLPGADASSATAHPAHHAPPRGFPARTSKGATANLTEKTWTELSRLALTLLQLVDYERSTSDYLFVGVAVSVCSASVNARAVLSGSCFEVGTVVVLQVHDVHTTSGSDDPQTAAERRQGQKWASGSRETGCRLA
jgi:hypothetical protein